MKASDKSGNSAFKLFKVKGSSANVEEKSEVFGFETWQPADKIVITDNLNRPLNTVSDPTTIQSVLDFIRQQQGWTIPEGGVPVARIRFNFYQGDRILGNLGVGATFLSTHHSGDFWSKASTKDVRDHLFELVGLELPDKG